MEASEKTLSASLNSHSVPFLSLCILLYDVEYVWPEIPLVLEEEKSVQNDNVQPKQHGGTNLLDRKPFILG
jgi:hypothetical protein